MSITFGTTIGPIEGFAFVCGHDNGLTAHRFGSYEDARTFLQAEYDTHGYTGGLAVCGDVEYCAYGLMSIQAIESDPAPDLNVSNANAMHLLGLLGLPSEPDECGSLGGSTTAEDFLGRVLIAQAVSPADAGVPVTTEVGQGGATMIDMGRRAGYSEDRLTELRELADFAVRFRSAGLVLF
jgi:hypothetical protein